MLLVSLLGERTAVDDVTGEVRTRSSRTIALIAFLALHTDQPQPRSRIASAFWPDSPEQQALTNLRRELHQLRALLGSDESLVVSPTDLTWRDLGTCRVDLCEHLRAREHARAAAPTEVDSLLEHGGRALETYRGELLPGLYDDWVLDHRAQLEDEVREVCGLVADAARRAGRWEVAIGATRRRIALAPLEEGAYRDLIRLQAAHGDRAGAVSTYHHCASVLEQELGLAPDPTTTRLLDELLARGSPPSDPATRPPPTARTSRTGLVGRREELDRLTTAYDEAGRGGVRTVLVTGEPGVGKTRLVAELAQHAARGGTVVATAHCYGAPGRLPLAPVVEWLGEPGLARNLAELPPVWRVEVERLIPLADASPTPAGARGVVDAWQRHRFFQGLSLALRPGRQALVLVLENLHWCDEETLDLLTFLLGSDPGAPVLVVLTARTRELADSTAHQAWVRRTRAAARLVEVGLAPLTLADTTALLQRLDPGVSSEGAAVLHSTTGGFPLHLIEAARRDRDLGRLAQGSPDLTAVLESRFDQLGPDCRHVAQLAAAIGRDFDLELLCEASDLSPDAVVQAVDELWRLRILLERRDGYDFSHDLLRSAAYHQIGPPGRWLLHRRVAQALELLHGHHPDAIAAQLADQYARAGMTARAREHYHRAAEVAARVFAHAEALHHHRAALALLATLPPGTDRDEQELRTLTSMAASLNALRGYSDPELAAALERAVSLAELLSQRETMIDALVGLWAARFVQGDIPLAHQIAERVMTLSSATSGAAGVLPGQAHFALAGSGLSLGRPASAAHHFELACAKSADEESLMIGSHPAIHGRAWSAHAHWLLGDADRAERCAHEAVDRARSLGHPYSLAIALGYAAISFQLLDQPGPMAGATDELGGLAARHGFAYYSEWGELLSGWAADDPAGTGRMERSIDRLRGVGAFCRMPYWLTLLAGRVASRDRARALLDAAVVSARSRQDLWWLPEVLRLRASLAPPPERRRDLAEGLALARAHGSLPLVERCERDLAATRTLGERPGS